LEVVVMNEKVGAGFGIMLFRDGKILLGRRHSDPEKADSELNGAGTWTMPGGKLEFSESFEEGARRELMEETGIFLDKVKVICVDNSKIDSAHFVTVGMFSEFFVGEARVMEPDEIVEWRWFGLDELPSPMYFPSERIVENYKLNRFYVKRD
jgi:8-oxo-dGTP diphosphatase